MVLLQRWLLLWLVLSSLAAYAYPAPFLATKGLLAWLIAGIMFSIGLMLPRREIAEVGRRWPTVFAGSLLQFSLMPTLAFIVGRGFGLSGDAFTGLMVVGCVPGAMASNVLTLNARGHTSYSVSLTTTATLLSPLVTPFALWLALQLNPEQSEAFSATTASLTLLYTVVLPVVAGFSLQRLAPRIEPIAVKWGPVAANLLILWVIAIVVAANQSKLAQATGVIVAPLLVLNLLGYAGGYFGGWMLRLPESMRRALTIEIGMQNAGAGAVLAATVFSETAALPPAIYTFGCMLTGVVLARWWSTIPVDNGAEKEDEKDKPLMNADER